MFENFSEFVVWLAGPGLPYFVGIVMSILASRIPAWDKLPTEVKATVPFVLAVVFGFAVRALNVPAIVNDPNINFAFNTIIFYLSTQAQYDRNNQRLQKLEDQKAI